MSRLTLGAMLLFFGFFLNACGGGGIGSLQSLKITSQVAVTSFQFTATGLYSSGKQLTPLSVGWFDFTFNSFLVGNPHYTLTKSRFVPLCTSGEVLIVMAIAPVDPNASATGTVPTAVFQDFATGKTNNEGGFIAATTQINCP